MIIGKENRVEGFINNSGQRLYINSRISNISWLIADSLYMDTTLFGMSHLEKIINVAKLL